MTYTVIGVDPAPTKNSLSYDGERWSEWRPQELRDRISEIKAPAILAWDAPLSFDRSDFYDRSVDATIRKWSRDMAKRGDFKEKAINAREFAALSHWTISCDALGMPFGQKHPGFELGEAAPSETSPSIVVIEVHPAVAIGILWIEASPGVPLPIYKGKDKVNRAAAKTIASILRFPEDAGKDDDHLDSYVAYRVGSQFRNCTARWLGKPEKGGYVLPDTEGHGTFRDLEELYRKIDNARTAKHERRQSRPRH